MYFCGGFQVCGGDWPFHFEDAWTTHPLFIDVVKETWKGFNKDIVKGLKFVKDHALSFNTKHFGNIFNNNNKRLLLPNLRGSRKLLIPILLIP